MPTPTDAIGQVSFRVTLVNVERNVVKYKTTPTQKEQGMQGDDFIILNSDQRQRINFCNRSWIGFIDYTHTRCLFAQDGRRELPRLGAGFKARAHGITTR